MEDLTLNNLLDLLKKAEKRTSPGIHKDRHSVKRFINEWDVRPGKDRIPTFVIFYTYRIKWKGQLRDKKTNLIDFFRTFAKHFKQVRTGKNRYYLLDGSVFDMTREGKLEAKHYEQTEKKRKKTLKQKRKNKISKPSKGNESEN